MSLRGLDARVFLQRPTGSAAPAASAAAAGGQGQQDVAVELESRAAQVAGASADAA